MTGLTSYNFLAPYQKRAFDSSCLSLNSDSLSTPVSFQGHSVRSARRQFFGHFVAGLMRQPIVFFTGLELFLASWQ
jgi:hypothetical protein